MSVGLIEQEKGSLDWEIIPSGELEIDHRNQLREFRQDLSNAQENGIRILQPESFGRHLDEGRPINTQMARNIEKLVTGSGRHLYLSPDYARLRESQIDGFSVLRTAGAETSAHGVFFGLLTDETAGQMLPVAIKPCKTKPATAYADWLSNSLIASTGRRHFKPIGFMIGEKANYSLTELEQGVETLDNTEWDGTLLDEHDPAYEGQREVLKKIGTTLATIHTQNIFHGDLQFKNIVVDVAGSVFFVDWESASFYNSAASTDTRTNKALHDFKVLFGSAARSDEMQGVGLLSRFDPSTQWRHFKNYVFNPYMEQYLEENEGEEAFTQIAEVESGLSDYIIQCGLKASLRRTRVRT